MNRPATRQDSPSIAEFGQRRAAAWRLARWWVLAAALGFAGIFFFANDADSAKFHLAFALAGIGIAGSAFVAKTYYRCPACEEPLMDHQGVHLSPRECPHCGERLSGN